MARIITIGYIQWYRTRIQTRETLNCLLYILLLEEGAVPTRAYALILQSCCHRIAYVILTILEVILTDLWS
jgi:hypothetical protein